MKDRKDDTQNMLLKVKSDLNNRSFIEQNQYNKSPIIKRNAKISNLKPNSEGDYGGGGGGQRQSLGLGKRSLKPLQMNSSSEILEFLDVSNAYCSNGITKQNDESPQKVKLIKLNSTRVESSSKHQGNI